MRSRIFEAKNLEIFKRLLRILAEYSKTVPATGVGRLLDTAIESGMKILPKDKIALEILDTVLDEQTIPESIQKLLNMRFSDCPAACRPLVKKGRRHEVAWWTRGKLISDRVKDLIAWEGESGSGSWTDLDGKKVTLVDLSVSKEKK